MIIRSRKYSKLGYSAARLRLTADGQLKVCLFGKTEGGPLFGKTEGRLEVCCWESGDLQSVDDERERERER